MRLHLCIRVREPEGLAPFESRTVGALEFRAVTEHGEARVFDGVTLPKPVYRGAVGEYSADDVAAFHDEVKHWVVRWHYRRGSEPREVRSSEVWDTRSADYVADWEDEALADWLSVEEIKTGVSVG